MANKGKKEVKKPENQAFLRVKKSLFRSRRPLAEESNVV